MEFSTSRPNAKTQKNAVGFMKKKATHIPRKNCGSSNIEENNCLNSWVDGDTTGNIEAKQST